MIATENNAMWEDPIVSEVRRTREELAARFGFDVKAIFDDLRSRQSTLGNRLVSRTKRPNEVETLPSAAGERSDSTRTVGGA